MLLREKNWKRCYIECETCLKNFFVLLIMRNVSGHLSRFFNTLFQTNMCLAIPKSCHIKIISSLNLYWKNQTGLAFLQRRNKFVPPPPPQKKDATRVFWIKKSGLLGGILLQLFHHDMSMQNTKLHREKSEKKLYMLLFFYSTENINVHVAWLQLNYQIFLHSSVSELHYILELFVKSENNYWEILFCDNCIILNFSFSKNGSKWQICYFGSKIVKLYWLNLFFLYTIPPKKFGKYNAEKFSMEVIFSNFGRSENDHKMQKFLATEKKPFFFGIHHIKYMFLIQDCFSPLFLRKITWSLV